MQADLKKIEDTGTAVVAISYDPTDALAKFAEKKSITFPLLSDPESKIIGAFGILNKDAKGNMAGIPYPGTFVIDKQGVIRGKLFHDGYRERHSTEELLKAIAAIK